MTKDEIRDIIIAKKNTIPALADLDETLASDTAVWLNEVEMVVEAIYAFNNILDQEKKDLIERAKRNKYGTAEWYKLEAMKYQHGHSLIFDQNNGTFGYDSVDESAQIIARCSVVETDSFSEIIIKVAKEVSGELEELASSELIGFQNYMHKVKIAGTNLITLSKPADAVNLLGTVYYDALYPVSDIKENINEVLDNYRTNFSFDGIIRTNDIIEAIRSAGGVRDFVPSTLEATSSIDGTITIVDSYSTRSGYFNYSATNVADTLSYNAL